MVINISSRSSTGYLEIYTHNSLPSLEPSLNLDENMSYLRGCLGDILNLNPGDCVDGLAKSNSDP